jgi:hypothetical protein
VQEGLSPDITAAVLAALQACANTQRGIASRRQNKRMRRFIVNPIVNPKSAIRFFFGGFGQSFDSTMALAIHKFDSLFLLVLKNV